MRSTALDRVKKLGAATAKKTIEMTTVSASVVSGVRRRRTLSKDRLRHGALRDRAGEEFVDEAPVAHVQDSIAIVVNFRHFVGDQQYGRAGVRELADDLVDSLPVADVDSD